MSYYLTKSGKEALKLNRAYREQAVITHEGRKVRVTGMTRGIPPRYLIEPVQK